MYQLVQGVWPDLQYLTVNDNVDLTVLDVYSISQDLVQKVGACEYAAIIHSRLAQAGNKTELSRLNDLPSSQSRSYFSLWMSYKPSNDP